MGLNGLLQDILTLLHIIVFHQHISLDENSALVLIYRLIGFSKCEVFCCIRLK
jgi:hypothetical protein